MSEILFTCKVCKEGKTREQAQLKSNGKLNSYTCKKCKSEIDKQKRREGTMKQPVRPECYFVWGSMKARCYYEGHKEWHNYGGRGITVCEEWRNSFETFVLDMGPRPTKKHTIERRNNNGNYEPSNCYWAVMKVQGNNKRNNRLLTYGGRTQTMTLWADELGITVYTMYQRLERGKMTLEQAIEYQPTLITYDGLSLNAEQWSERTGIKAATIHKRLERGWSPEKALTYPVRDWGR